MLNKNNMIRTWFLVGLLLAGLTLAACSSAGDDGTMEEMNHDSDEMEHDDDHDHDDATDRIPNESGATIAITTPEDGDTFSTLDQVLVEVDVQNFALGEDGNHWHVYVDGVSFGMVMGSNLDQALPGLDPGEHEISVYVANGEHEEYEDGDAVTIIVEE